MSTAAQANLTPAERAVLERFVDLLRAELGDDLIAVWLYGSRARGERHSESDIDVLVLTRLGRDDRRQVVRLASSAEDVSDEVTWVLSPLVQSPEWVEGRRAIDAFFIQEVDRDKIVLHGDP